MPHLYELVQKNVAAWRNAGYLRQDYPAIAEILDYAILPHSHALRFVRVAQLRRHQSVDTTRISAPHLASNTCSDRWTR